MFAGDETLTAYRDGDPCRIITKLADASFTAITNGRQLVIQLRATRASWNDKIKARRGAVAWRLADLLARQPVIDAPTVAAELRLVPQNAERAIAPLDARHKAQSTYQAARG